MKRGLGVRLLWANEWRAPSPRRRSRRDRTDTATGRRRGLSHVIASAIESRGARPARVSHHGVTSDWPRSTRRVARRGACAVPHAIGRGATAPSPRLIDARGFERSCTARFESRGARPARVSQHEVAALRPRSIARAAQCGPGMVVARANARRGPPHAVGRGASAPMPRSVDARSFVRS